MGEMGLFFSCRYLQLTLGTFEGLYAFRWGLLGYGVGLPLAIGFGWVALLFVFAGVFIWMLVVVLLASFVCFDITLFIKVHGEKTHVVSLPECRTPTFARCPQFDSKKKNALT